MNSLQISRIKNLSFCNVLPAERKYIYSMNARVLEYQCENDLRPLTQKQHIYLAKLSWKYKKQLPFSCCPRKNPNNMNRQDIENEMKKDLF